uniref:Putative secreted protein n=1 Tax=Anopheles darlingi TaxID=43151 RepID=A0A2M4DPT8_ANODA
MQLNGLVILGVWPRGVLEKLLALLLFPPLYWRTMAEARFLEENLRTYISSTGHRNTTLQGTERLLLYVVRWY